MRRPISKVYINSPQNVDCRVRETYRSSRWHW